MILYVLDTSYPRLHVFSSEAELQKFCEGLSVVEGDWLFFAEDGTPLEAVFSEQPRIYAEKNTYANGQYTLRPTSGDRLEVKFPGVEFVNGHLMIKDTRYEHEREKEWAKIESGK